MTDLVVGVVDSVRDKTTGPILTASRAVVYGLVAAIVGAVTLVVVLLTAVRVLDHFVPGGVWIIYTAMGALLTVGGLFVWSKRTAGS